MAQTKFFWKVWLRANLLTKDVDNDYIAEVSTVNETRRNEDIASRILEVGSEISYDTILSVLNRSDNVVRSMLQSGQSVQTGVCRLSPRVSGTWLGSNATFDPAVHKITLDIVPTAEMREALTSVGVEVLDVKGSGAYIGLVTDTATGLTDGTITAGDDILIEGDKIRIAPDDDDTLGVFLVDSTGKATKVTRRLTQNDPKTVLARVPALPAGDYTLRIVTRFSNASTSLKEARTIVYARLLTVK